jgi:hypothetical protein
VYDVLLVLLPHIPQHTSVFHWCMVLLLFPLMHNHRGTTNEWYTFLLVGCILLLLLCSSAYQPTQHRMDALPSFTVYGACMCYSLPTNIQPEDSAATNGVAGTSLVYVDGWSMLPTNSYREGTTNEWYTFLLVACGAILLIQQRNTQSASWLGMDVLVLMYYQHSAHGCCTYGVLTILPLGSVCW